MSHIEPVEPMISQLPPELQKEAVAYIKLLLKKSRKIVKHKMTLEWAGGLSYLKDSYSSVELQHRIPDWWS
jgi:hypothetical protein